MVAILRSASRAGTTLAAILARATVTARTFARWFDDAADLFEAPIACEIAQDHLDDTDEDARLSCAE